MTKARLTASDRLLKAPIWDQNNDPLPDGHEDPADVTDCGEECVAMVVSLLRGASFAAGCIRQAWLIPPDNGRTLASQLASMLASFRISSTVLATSPDHLYGLVSRRAMHGQASICLGYWEDPYDLHWVLAVGVTPQGILVNDPWKGTRRELGEAAWHMMSTGVSVGVDEPA